MCGLASPASVNAHPGLYCFNNHFVLTVIDILSQLSSLLSPHTYKRRRKSLITRLPAWLAVCRQDIESSFSRYFQRFKGNYVVTASNNLNRLER